MSGAKNCPETPRQKMIGMMYLVLTAMLALNVSSEVLQGFSMVDDSLRASIQSTDARVGVLYRNFSDLNEQNSAKVEEWYKKAQELQQKSDSLYNFIQDFKYQMIRLADGSSADPNAVEIKAKDNLDVAGQYALNNNAKNGKELKDRILDYRNFLISTTQGDSLKQATYETVFNLEGSPGKTWEQSMFEMMPLSAAVTLLTKYQSDIRTAEMDMIQYLTGQTDASDFRVNKIEALVVPNSRYVMRGSEYSAQIVLSAVDSTARPDFYVNDQNIGKEGLYRSSANKIGLNQYSGYISLPGNDGIIRTYKFSSDYTVGEPMATISNVDLNVAYRGIDNKFSISVPGVSTEDIEVAAKGAKVQKSGGYYIINPTQDEDITITVSARMDGKLVQMGSSQYRVKYIPDPKSYVQYRDNGGVVRQIQEGRLSKNVLRSDDFALIASYGADELIQAKFDVISFSMTTKIGTVDTQGNKLTQRQLEDINRLERGDFITFRNIKAKGPDGKVRTLGLLQVDI